MVAEWVDKDIRMNSDHEDNDDTVINNRRDNAGIMTLDWITTLDNDGRVDSDTGVGICTEGYDGTVANDTGVDSDRIVIADWITPLWWIMI